jgi:phosphoribosyl 1,2-cyclic phosphodiesterase
MTHTHWDHIQGFPFFAPAYHPEFELTIYSAKGFSKDLSSVFRGQLDVDYFPVQMDDMQARLRFQELPVGALELQGMSLTWEYAQHPGATVGYRIEVGGRSIAFVPDNEFLKGFLGTHDEVGADPHMLEIYQPMIDHLMGVDVLIHEAQYTPEEYVSKVGWGHTSVPNACYLCKATSPKQWIVTHHDPGHSDDFLQHKLNLTRQLLRDLDCATEVRHGFDGLVEYL